MRPIPGQRPLAGIVSEDQDNSLLGNVSRFMSRPTYAVSSILRGEFGDAFENLFQMGMDFPTGGFLNRNLSLANLISETGDITTREERPEASDLIGYEGQGPLRVGVDVVGGILLDPLTYLTLGGSGVAKGALAGLGKGAAAAKVASKLGKTTGGASALKNMVGSVIRGSADDTLRLSGLGGKLGKAFDDGTLSGLEGLLKASDDVLAGIFPEIGEEGARRLAAAKAARGIEAKAVDALMSKALRKKVRLGRHASEEALDSGVRALVGEGYLLDDAAMRLDIPFTDINKTVQLPGFSGENIWGKIGGLTAPGFGLKALRVINAPMADMVEASGRAAWAWTKETFYDGVGKAGTKAGIQHTVRGAKFKHAGALKRAAITTRELFKGLDDEGAESLGRLASEAEDSWLTVVESSVKEAGDKAFERAEWANQHVDQAKIAAEWAEHNTRAHFATKAGKAEILQKMTRRLAKDAADGWSSTNELGEVIEHAGLGKNGARAIRGYLDEMQKIPDELVKLGVWSKKDPNPFYVPHQIKPVLAEILGDPLARQNEQLMQGIKDVFAGKRKIKTAKEFAEFVTKKVDMSANNVPEILKELAEAGADEAMEFNLRDLTFKRLAAHANTVKRSTIWEEGKRLGMLPTAEGAGDAALKTYVEGQLKGVGTPDSDIYRFLAGGKIKVPISPEQADRLRKAGKTVVNEGGRDLVVHEVKGINHYVKPLLTSFPTNPAFHIRNWLGAMLMTTLDPDLGFKNIADATSEFWGSIPGMAWSKALGDQGNSRKLTAMVIEAANGSEAAMKELARSNAMIGKYTIQEAVEAVQNGVGKVSQADLASNVGDELAELMGKAATTEGRGKLGRGYDAMVKFGEKGANHTEEGMRTAGILRLMKQGVDPTEAIRRTNRALVDYSSQSIAESWARQVFPFAKFAIGSSAWLGEFARRPRLLNAITHARSSAEAQLGENEVLPERVADSFALPFGKDETGNMRYMTSLGLPHEASLNMLSAVSSPKGFRKNILGAMHPAAKLPLEAATNRDFFFGDKFGSYTQAPNVLPRFLTTEVKGKNGKVRYEIPGFYRELFDAAPTSRMLKTLDRFLDDKRTLFDATLQSISGVRIQSVDQKRELRTAIETYLKSKVDSGQVIEFSNWIAKGDPKDAPEDLKIVLAGLRDMRKKKKKKKGRRP